MYTTYNKTNPQPWLGLDIIHTYYNIIISMYRNITIST